MTKPLSDDWRTTTVANALLFPPAWPLYASPRGHRVTDIRRDKLWFVVTYASGGKRYVHAEKLLYYRNRK